MDLSEPDRLYDATDTQPHVRADRGNAPLVRIGGAYALPERFTAIVEPAEPDLPICELAILVEDGRPICEVLRLERRSGGPPIGGGLLRRLPVSEYVHWAADQVGHSIELADQDFSVRIEGESFPIPTEPFDEGHVAMKLSGVSYTAAYKSASRAPRQAGAVSEGTLQEVADVYRRALAKGEGPTQAVMEEWTVSRSTASRWVKRARQAGLLGPARPRVAGG